jgi:hypothetical protein
MDKIEKIEELTRHINFEVLHPPTAEISIKRHKKLQKLLKELNNETDWVGILGDFDKFLEELVSEEDSFIESLERLNKSKFLEVSIDKIILQSNDLKNQSGIWEYCDDLNHLIAVFEQNKKLKYLISCLKECGFYFKGNDDILELESYELVDLRGEQNFVVVSEKQKQTAKLSLAILYKLGIYDHLKNINSLKFNDSAYSRVLDSFLGGGKSIYQPYLSAAKSNAKSISKQNNPFSKKLLEQAEDILDKAGVSYSDLVKNP